MRVPLEIQADTRPRKRGNSIKNGEERLVVLNRVARAVVESVRGQHSEFVFTYREHLVETMNNNA